MSAKKVDGLSAPAIRRDPYKVLSVPKDANDQEINSAYRNLSLKYHPDTNEDNLEASDLYKEVAFSYSILSNPKKRRQYDYAGFKAIDANQIDMEYDLSNHGTISIVLAALFSNLGVPIKTSVNANVLEEARNGTFTLKPLPIGTSVSGKVDKQRADFFRVTISEEQAKSGVVVRVTSTEQSKFKEESEITCKVTSSGMYFLHFQVYRIRMVLTLNPLKELNDPDQTDLFKGLERLQPCEVTELRAGTHIFAVYGGNFFKSTSYTIEALCAKTYEGTIEKLKENEAKVLTKRFDLRQFETEYQQLEIEYRKALARFEKGTKRYSQEMQNMDELLKQRDSIRSSFSAVKTPSGNNLSNGSSCKAQGEESKGEGDSVVEEGEPESKNRSKNKWFNFNLDGYENKKLD